MTWLVGQAEPAPYGALAAATVFVVLAMWAGVRLWRGQWPGPSGPRPRYQTYFGGMYLAVPFGAGFLVIAVSEMVRGALGLDRQSAFSWVTGLVGFAILAVTGVVTLAYYWTGVPPRLRPPYQRDQRPVGSREEYGVTWGDDW